MKFWWPHDETIIATLVAYELTGDEKYAQWHQRIHDWSHRHFADPFPLLLLYRIYRAEKKKRDSKPMYADINETLA